jgi:tetratricopeptide (TPR) repeat protein
MFRIFSASREGTALGRLLAEYPVDFIMVEVAQKELAAQSRKLADFAPVFFDDVMVLLAHRGRQAAVVERYEIRFLNPFNLLDAAQPLESRLGELERVAGIHPEGNRVNHAMTRLLVDAKRYAEAETWAERFRAHHPSDPNSLYLTGNILENTGRCAAAIPYYERAFDTADRSFRHVLHQHIGTCHYVLKDFSRAYSHFRSGINVYLRSEPPETIYQYAFSSVIVGDTDRARRLLQAILYETPDSREDITARARGLLARIDSDPSLSPDMPGWVRALLP